IAEAVVEFPYSRIYDEYDFKEKSTLVINDLCAESCRIYASITADSKKYAANLLIQLPKGFISTADVAAKVDTSTGQKLFLEITKTASVSIVNVNSQMAAGPFVLYVVNSAEIINDSEVYEAEGMIRPVSTVPRYITVMSARLFTIHGAPLPRMKVISSAQGFIATMSGFDRMEDGNCPHLYYTINYRSPGFKMEVNGPILTIEYDYKKKEISATIGIANKFDGAFARNGWIGSPGFHGCPGLQPYRVSTIPSSSRHFTHRSRISNLRVSIWR
ncbi:hypothetical protein PMAYCL1PPCAC_17080, partial [Pristionchus mayeri]